MNPETTQVPAKNHLVAKLLLIGKVCFVAFLMLLLNLPMAMIQSLIGERESRRESVEREVSSTWGTAQSLLGPVLTIPYLSHYQDEKGKVYTQTHFAHFLPEQLEIRGGVEPEVRYRSIYRVLLYRGNFQIKGHFARPDWTKWSVAAEDILWQEAFLSMGISDTRAIQEQVQCLWNETNLAFEPGNAGRGVLQSGIQVALPLLKEQADRSVHSFQFDLKLAGSRSLEFAPFGKETRVALQSTWNSPSFMGAYLPTQRSIDDRGFSAQWKIPYLGRSYPQQWRDNELGENAQQSEATLQRSSFGVFFLFPVETYQMTTRSAKYAILFIVLTFVAYVFFEVFNKVSVHPVHYLLVGFAICLFYLLLLSLSEHLHFYLAYLIAASATVALITLYSRRTLKNDRRAFTMGSILVSLYAYLYLLLRAQDYALLMGSVGLFAILALIMWVTRKLDSQTLSKA